MGEVLFLISPNPFPENPRCCRHTWQTARLPGQQVASWVVSADPAKFSPALRPLSLSCVWHLKVLHKIDMLSRSSKKIYQFIAGKNMPCDQYVTIDFTPNVAIFYSSWSKRHVRKGVKVINTSQVAPKMFAWQKSKWKSREMISVHCMSRIILWEFMMLQPVELLDLYDKGLLLLCQQVPQVNVGLLLSVKICIDGTGCLAHYCPKLLYRSVDR